MGNIVWAGPARPATGLQALLVVVGAFFLALAMFGCPPPAAAQTVAAPAPPVTLADAAMPTALLMEVAMKCAESKDKATRKFCLELIRIEAKRGMKIANEAADAAQANRPVVVAPYGGYYGGGYGYGGYGYGGYGGYGGGYDAFYTTGAYLRQPVYYPPPPPPTTGGGYDTGAHRRRVR